MKRILVAAGDRALTRFVAEALLGRQLTRANPALHGNGFDLSRAHSALESEMLILHGRRSFDVIVVDHDLPGSDLLSFLTDLRRTEATSDVPVFVMSERGRDQLTRRLASERYHVAGFLDKPVTAASLRECLDDLDRLRSVHVVDYDAVRLRIIRTALMEAGYEVRVSRTAREAMTEILINRPDAMLSALKLEDGDGAALCAHFKQSPGTQTLPVLLYGDIEVLARLEIAENAHRADDFLREPFDQATLVSRIAPLIGRASAKPSSEPGAPPGTREIDPPLVIPVAPQIPSSARDTEAPPKSVTTAIETPAPRDFAEDDMHQTESGLRTLETTATGAIVAPDPTAASPLHLPPASASPSTSTPRKRATRRVPCHVRVKVREGETIYESETLNISNGGILIATDHPLEVGTKIALEFQLPNTTELIGAVGKVAWIGGVPSGNRTTAVGVKFSEIDPEHLKLIVAYVNRLSKVVYVAP